MKRFSILVILAIFNIGINSACFSSENTNDNLNGVISAETTQEPDSSENDLASSENNATATPTPETKKQTDILSTFKKGDEYKTIVREKLLKDGWKPAPAEDADKCGSGDSTCDEFPEMNHCSGTGLGNCEFRWQKESKILLVYTVGRPHIYNTYEFEKK